MAAATITSRWWSKETVAVVTGSNKGIGFEIVRGLAKQGITTVLTARDHARGREASSKLAAQGLDVVFHPLDVTSSDSIGNFATWLQKEYGGLDILINNAGIAKPDVSYDNATDILETNFYGVKRVTEKLLPLLRSSPAGSRIVNLGSRLGQLHNFENDAVKRQLREVDQFDEDILESLAQKYLEDVKSGVWRSKGWAKSNPQYSESKLFLHAYVRLLAKSLSRQPKGHQIFVNVVCPGFISTDMTNNSSMASSLETGADTPLWLALLPDEVPSGKFVAERREIRF